jgi:hypothetical protein
MGRPTLSRLSSIILTGHGYYVLSLSPTGYKLPPMPFFILAPQLNFLCAGLSPVSPTPKGGSLTPFSADYLFNLARTNFLVESAPSLGLAGLRSS